MFKIAFIFSYYDLNASVYKTKKFSNLEPAYVDDVSVYFIYSYLFHMCGCNYICARKYIIKMLKFIIDL